LRVERLIDAVHRYEDTLKAHRVALLIINGADPRRIMLLTFSHRAAAEMGRRVERMAANVMRGRGATVTDAAPRGLRGTVPCRRHTLLVISIFELHCPIG